MDKNVTRRSFLAAASAAVLATPAAEKPAGRTDMDQIAEAMRKIQAYAGELARV